MTENFLEISEKMFRCWGKTDPNDPTAFHPAFFHMLDVGNVARVLLSERTSFRWNKVLARCFVIPSENLSDWLPFWVALHDIGKISVSFQCEVPQQFARLQEEDILTEKVNYIPHNQIGQIFIREWVQSFESGLDEDLGLILREAVGGHHGFFPAQGDLTKIQTELRIKEPPEWQSMRQSAAKLLEEIFLIAYPPIETTTINISGAVMALTGFTILCDWIGSNSLFFPVSNISSEKYLPISQQRAWNAVEKAGFFQPCFSSVSTSFSQLFSNLLTPRPLQLAMDDIPDMVLQQPCLAVIEAPTGEGKTEAALALAHRIARITGTDEFYYALPTTATSNQMYIRVQNYIFDHLQLPTQTRLIHGQAMLVEDSLRIIPAGNGHETSNTSIDWFSARKRALLAPFGVGTVDQAELGVLNVRHTALRLLGLAGKVLIIDEVHAYDMYMTTIIERLLTWLAALGTSVILLSATLPETKRALLVRAYTGKESTEDDLCAAAYPNLYICGAAGKYQASPAADQKDHQVGINYLHLGEDVVQKKENWLLAAIQEGGCACWITNTVQRAQDLYQAVRSQAGPEVDVLLIHARFPLILRQELETRLTHKYGPDKSNRPVRGIVIGTQVLEQSLDLDFDVMVTDLAPIDLLLQRAGRLHRHKHTIRPEKHSKEQLWINVPLTDEGDYLPGSDKYVYDEYILRKSWQTLRSLDILHLPGDYRRLIENVYQPGSPSINDPLFPYWKQLEKKEINASNEARIRLIPEPNPEESICTLMSQLRFEEKEGSAAWLVGQTRLGEESLNIIPMEQVGNSCRLVCPQSKWMDMHLPLSTEDALTMLASNMRISDRGAVNALKQMEVPRMFTESPLLRDYIPIWFENGHCFLADRSVTIEFVLDPELGLIINKLKGGG